MDKGKKRTIKAEDLYRIELIFDPAISPDGKNIIFCKQWIDKNSEKKYSNLWVINLDNKKKSQFTYGEQYDRNPIWSPSGNRVVFISKRNIEDQEQIYIIPFHGGEARNLTDLKGTFGKVEYSPDGKKLVFQFRKKDREEIEIEKDEEKKKLGVLSRNIERPFFKFDGTGILPKERWHIWTVSTVTGKVKQITDGDKYDELEPAWYPDSKKILFLSNHSDEPDLDPDAISLFTVPAAGGRQSEIKTPFGVKSNPVFSPDGKKIAYFGKEGRGVWWKLNSLWVVDVEGNNNSKNLTEKFDIFVSNATLTDIKIGSFVMSPVWSEDSSRIYFQVSEQGHTKLHSISLDGNMQEVIDADGVVGPFNFDGKQSKLLYYHAGMQDPGQLFLLDMKSGKTTKLTEFNKKLFSKIDLGEVEEVWFEGKSGHKIQGWIIKPPDFKKSRKYPSILEIHGGPRLQYGNFFMHEFFFFASKGYIVYFCNPRGSQGYGEKYSKSIWNDWGSPVYEDLMSWNDYMKKKSYIDIESMGVTGGSYGGYMTNWIIGHTNRFKAAVTQRSVSNLISMWGSSDFNWAFQQEFGGKPPWEDIENYWNQSPMKYMGNVETPTMVIHSEKDYRCDIEQAEQVFVALKRLGVDTEMIRFPDEPHGLSRSGRTDRRIARLKHILRWFDKYLKDK